VGYVKTQLSCILFIMLTTIYFGHCGTIFWLQKFIYLFVTWRWPTVAEMYRRQHKN